MRIGSLFAGYGGLDQAVEAVFGGYLAWYSEIDKGALKILEHRYPGVPNVGDVTATDWSQVEPVDILTGGSPCQDLSHAGRRAGMTEGTRSNLWVAMREAIAQLRPRIVVWENVRGAFSAAADSAVEPCPGCVGDGSGVHLRALGRVLGDLSDLGYDARWHGLRAADVGAPHGRFRVFVVAVDSTVSGLQGATGGRIQHGVSGVGHRGHLLPTPRATDGTKGGPGQRGSSGDLMLPSVVVLLPTPSVADSEGTRAARGGARSDELLLNGIAKEVAAAERGLQWTDEEAPNYAPYYAVVRDERWGDYAAAITHWDHTLGRPAPEPTQLSKNGNPQLSARFVEWLMGLPDGWVTDAPGITRNEALKALGNGVVPQQAIAALRHMLAA